MRWFVEISSAGPSAEPPVELTVEAPQWQPALQKARALRGDEGALGNFSIELLDDGYKAVDPVKRLRYVVRKAPDTAQLTPVSAVPQAAPEPPKARPLAQTAAFASSGSAAVRAEAQAIAQAKTSAVAVAVAAPPRVATPPRATPAAAPAGSPSLPSYRVLSSREENPTASSPLTYREFVYVVPEGTSIDASKRLMQERFESVKKALDGVRGVLVNLAVFDHVFQGRPQHQPCVALTWKDWRGDPEIRVSQPSNTSSAPPVAAAAPAAAPAPAPAARPVSTPPARTASTKSTPPKARVRSAEELMKELEGAATDLHFLSESLEGADFVISILTEQLPSELVLVWFYDKEKRELVLVRQQGGKHDRLLARMPDRTGLAQAAISSKKALVITDATRDPRAVDARWKAFGVDPKSIACAPAIGSGGTLGLIEIVNPVGGGRYATTEGNALTYVGQQLAEFLSIQGVVLDPDQIRATAKKTAR